jgi:hypothetical protein
MSAGRIKKEIEVSWYRIYPDTLLVVIVDVIMYGCG